MIRPLVFLPLISVVIVSGCIIPGWGGDTTTGESNVIVIESLSAIPSTIQTQQSVKLVAILKNQGQEKVPQTNRGVTGAIEANLYNYCPGLFKLPSEESGIVCSGGSKEQSSEGGYDICKLESLTVNEKRQVEWTLEQSPETLVEASCDMEMSVRYPYKTTGLTTIHMINSDELQRQITEGTYQDKGSSITKGEGPVKVWFEVSDSQPVSVPHAGEGQMTLELNIKNTGSGRLVGNKATITDISLASIEGEDKITLQSCDEVSEGSEITLIQGSYTKICPANIDSAITNFPKESTVHVTVTIEYAYEVDKSVKVTVEPMIS